MIDLFCLRACTPYERTIYNIQRKDGCYFQPVGGAGSPWMDDTHFSRQHTALSVVADCHVVCMNNSGCHFTSIHILQTAI